MLDFRCRTGARLCRFPDRNPIFVSVVLLTGRVRHLCQLSAVVLPNQTVARRKARRPIQMPTAQASREEVTVDCSKIRVTSGRFVRRGNLLAVCTVEADGIRIPDCCAFGREYGDVAVTLPPGDWMDPEQGRLVIPLASSHPETHYLSFLTGRFLCQIQRFIGPVLTNSSDRVAEWSRRRFRQTPHPQDPPPLWPPGTR